MTKLSFILPLIVGLLAASSEARADPPQVSSWDDDEGMGISGRLYASNRVCAPGSQVACGCPNGGRGAATCDPTGLRFSLCACAAVTVLVPQVAVPTVVVPEVDFRHRKRKPSRRWSGLGMLIGGATAITVGVPNLLWGIKRVRDSADADVEGILSTVHGGLCLATGLPLLIVGAVLLGTRGLNPEQPPGVSKSAPIFTLTPTGFAAQF